MTEAKETKLEDWGIFDNESQISLPKNKAPNKNQKEEKEEEIDTSSPKKKNKKIKLKPKERNEKENTEQNNEDEMQITSKKNLVYQTILKHMKNLQPDASKSIKRKTYEIIKNYVAQNDLDDDSYDLIIKGDEKNEILGLCELISKKTRTGSFKGSTFEFLKIVHYWFRDIEEEKSKKMVENFSLNEDYVKLMKLGDHYSRLCNSTKKEEKKLSHQIIHILRDILDMRKTLELKDLIKFGFIDTIQKGLDKYEAALIKKRQKEEKIKEEENKDINNNIKDNNNNKNSNTKKASSKTFKKQTNNVNKNKKKVIIKKYFNQEEKGDNKSKINFDKFNPKNCLYEKIIKKSVTKIEIYDDSKESMSQIIKRDSTMDDSKIKSTNNSLYNKPILKPIKINNLKKIIKNDENRPSFSVKLNKSIISADGSQSRKKNIFMKKEKYKNSNSSLNGKNNEMNINTINTERNKNNKRLSISRGSMTTLSASRNEYLKNINNKNNQSNLQSNLWKFANDIPYNDKIMYQSSLSNNLLSEISNEYKSINKVPIFDWRKDIGLHCYYNLFIEKKIFSMQKVITNLKSGKYIITKTDIEKIGIIIHGHIYRILTKLEIDSEKINQKIINLFINSRKNKGKEINIMNNSVYFCCGCCATNERKILNKIKKDFNLDQWLNKMKMIKYKDNFIENGFDLFEYFILQMFTSIPVDDHILKDELDIQNDKDRDIILLRLNKDVKYMMLKVGENNFEDISKEENKLYEFDNQASETKSECIII